jgi:hypothetical protein
MEPAARIKIGFSKHPKTQALLSRLGYTGGFSFVCLLAWASATRPNGDLAGMSDAEIEDRAEWPGGDGVLIRELATSGFLVGMPGSRRIHDFEEHNPISVMQRKPVIRENVPVDDIVNLYHDMLCPPLPTITKITAQRRAKIKARWNDSMPEFAHWKDYFDLVKRSPFLMGRCAPKREGDRSFRADLDFLIRSEDMPVKIAEGKYHG